MEVTLPDGISSVSVLPAPPPSFQLTLSVGSGVESICPEALKHSFVKTISIKYPFPETVLDQLKEACEGEVLKELHFLNSDEDVVRSYQLPAGLQAAASDLRDFCSAAVVARKAGAPGFFASAPVEAGGKKGLSGAFPK